MKSLFTKSLLNCTIRRKRVLQPQLGPEFTQMTVRVPGAQHIETGRPSLPKRSWVFALAGPEVVHPGNEVSSSPAAQIWPAEATKRDADSNITARQPVSFGESRKTGLSQED
jgi:hypothetical protein